MQPGDAIAIFFAPERSISWNPQFGRFETLTEEEGIHWFWIAENEVVMITSCFLRY